MAELETATLSPSTVGYQQFNTLIGQYFWFPGEPATAGFVPLFSQNVIGLIFDVNTTAGPNGPYRYSELTLNVTYTGTGGAGTTVNFMLDTDLTPVYPDGNSPNLPGRDGSLPVLRQVVGGWQAGVPTAVPLGTTLTDPVTGTTTMELSTDMRAVLEPSSTPATPNSGQLGIVIYGTNNWIEFTDFSLDVTRVPYWTGEAGGPWVNQRVRVPLDHRFGMPTNAEHLVEDDFLPGTWVRPEDWDPEDPEPDYTGNPTEHEKEDDVDL